MSAASGESEAALAAHRLRQAGYPFVSIDFGGHDARFDVVAFLPNHHAILEPHAVVEIKKGGLSSASKSSALDQLSFARQQLGTVKHYLINDQQWFQADRGLLDLTSVDGPENVDRLHPEAAGLVANETMIRTLLDREVFIAADRFRSSPDAIRQAVVDTLRRAGDIRNFGVEGDIAFEPTALWNVVRQWVPATLARSRYDEFSTPAPLADVMARLIGSPHGTVLDPFCGTGLLLHHVAGHDVKSHTEYVGRDVAADILDLAKALAEISPLAMEFQAADSYQESLPTADFVISAPPIGVKFNRPEQLSSGGRTTDGDLLSIDSCWRALKPGGRAVLLTSRGWTFRVSGVEFRSYLAQHGRVSALIGLPGNLLKTTSISMLIVVLEKKASGPTFVAELASDWQEQLAPSGEAWAALTEHLDGRVGGGSADGD